MADEKKIFDLHRMQVEKMKEIDRYRDTFRPDECKECRFLYYWRPPKTGAWCVLWREDRDWKQEACQSGVKKYTR